MDWQNLEYYAQSLKWPLFPCRADTKAPLTSHGFKDVYTNIITIKAWYIQYPGCMWATPTSAERGVLDIDPRHEGDKTLAALEAEHGTLPLTPKVKTGGGGFHYYMKFPPGTRNGEHLAQGIDRRADGGYVIIPTSQSTIPEHEGRAYAWEVRPWEAAIAEAPAWVVGLKAGAKAKAGTNPSAGADADPWVVRPADDLTTHPGSVARELGGEGRRPTLLRLVGSHLARGDDEDAILAMTEQWAGRCTPPLEDWHDHASGVIAKEEAKGLAFGSTEPRGGEPYPPRTSVALCVWVSWPCASNFSGGTNPRWASIY